MLSYTGVLSSNPIHDDYQTSYPRVEPYALADLAECSIPKGWRVPFRYRRRARGRTASLFAAVRTAKLGDSAVRTMACLTWARTINIELSPCR